MNTYHFISCVTGQNKLYKIHLTSRKWEIPKRRTRKITVSAIITSQPALCCIGPIFVHLPWAPSLGSLPPPRLPWKPPPFACHTQDEGPGLSFPASAGPGCPSPTLSGLARALPSLWRLPHSPQQGSVCSALSSLPCCPSDLPCLHRLPLALGHLGTHPVYMLPGPGCKQVPPRYSLSKCVH